MEGSPLSLNPEELLEHAAWAHSLARQLVGESAAEDLVQETWLAALRRPPRSDRPLRPWLGTVLGNFARQRSRGRGRRARREAEAAREEAGPSVEELTLKVESQKLLMEALLELEPSLREVLLLRFFEELSAAEIARRQGVPASTVKSRLSRALEELRVRLDGHFDGDRRHWCVLLLPLLREKSVGLSTAAGLSASLTGVLWMKTLAKISVLLLLGLIGGLGLVAAIPFAARLLDSVPREEVAFAPLTPPERAEPAVETPEVGESKREPVSLAVADEPERSGARRARIEARFVDEHRRAVAGVEVSAHRSSGPDPRSGPDGRVDLEVDPVGELTWGELDYRHPRFATDGVEFELQPGRDLDLGDIVLRSGGALRGQVVDGAGRPLAGARVSVPGEPEVSPMAGGMTRTTGTSLGAASVSTDERGFFRLEGLLAGEVRVRAEAENELYQGQSGWVEIRPGEESSGLVVVAPMVPAGERIEGVVLDPEGNPLKYCGVRATYRTFFGSGSIGETTDQDGSFRLILRADTPHVLVVDPPRGREWNPVILEQVEPGDLNVVIRFQESTSFELLVRDERGKPVEQYAAVVWDVDREHVLQRIDRAPCPGGRTALRVPLAPFQVYVDAPGYAGELAGVFQPEALEQPGETVAITLHSLPGITGRVTANGAPVSGASVYLQERASDRTTVNGFPVRYSSRYRERTETGEDGRFRLELREAGELVVRVEAPGLAARELGPFELDPERGLADLECELTAGGSIRGRVLSGPGIAPAGSIVAVSRGDCWAHTQRVGADGIFLFEHLTPGPWQVVRVDREIIDQEYDSESGFGSAFDETPSNCVVIEGRVTRFDLIETPVPVCRLTGRLELGEHELSGWRATLIELGPVTGPVHREAHESRLDSAGRFDFTIVGEGPIRLTLTDPRQSGVVVVVDIELLSGRNKWSAKLPAAALQVSNPNRVSAAYVYEGADGLFVVGPLLAESAEPIRLDPVPAGRARIALIDPSLPEDDPTAWPTLLELNLKAGEIKVLTLP